MAKREKSPTRAQKIAAAKITSIKCKLMTTYQTATAHRADLDARVRGVLAKIQDSYAYDGKSGADERQEIADETLDYIIERFDRNGYSNRWSRVAMTRHMLDLLRPIGARSNEVVNLLEKTFMGREDELTAHMRYELTQIRERQVAHGLRKLMAA